MLIASLMLIKTMIICTIKWPFDIKPINFHDKTV